MKKDTIIYDIGDIKFGLSSFETVLLLKVLF